MLLSRDTFRDQVFSRDNNKCIICGEPAADAHHIMERRLFNDGGYYIDNGASLCAEHHIQAEQTLLNIEEILNKLNITRRVLPEGYYSDVNYDKWGNIILPNGTRLRGELFDDSSVQKVLKPVLSTFTKYVKYPRTYHLPWSNGTKDDRFLPDDSQFISRRVIVTEKMDGENTTLYNDYIHARSLEYDSHDSRNLIKAFHARVGYNIPENMRVCCENVTAVHSIQYEYPLDHFCLGFSVWRDNWCLSWDETVEWLELLEISAVPILYDGIYDSQLIHSLYETKKADAAIEGYVVRIADQFHIKDFKRSIAKFVRLNHIDEQAHHWKYKKVRFNSYESDF